jgi:phosphoribosylformylglycinamidine cyclo-ligase
MALTYEAAGVSIDQGNLLVDMIKPLARSTRTPWVVEDIGGFAGLCNIPPGIEDPVLVSGTDGVGTKLKVALDLGIYDTIGIDLVAMCVNDIATTGATPLFFLDYLACGKLDAKVAGALVKGIAEGCRQAGCALLGGETAEHPGVSRDGEYDLAGFAVGIAPRKALLGPKRVRAGDALIAVSSSGVHANGLSLAREVLRRSDLSFVDDVQALGGRIGDVLLTPTRIYAKALAKLQQQLTDGLHAACHVTGGGITENLPRVLPEGTLASVDRVRDVPAIFRFLAENGPVEEAEMYRTFNMGVGLVVVVREASSADAVRILSEGGGRAWQIGNIETAPSGTPPRVHYR